MFRVPRSFEAASACLGIVKTMQKASILCTLRVRGASKPCKKLVFVGLLVLPGVDFHRMSRGSVLPGPFETDETGFEQRFWGPGGGK